jgi:hypothetical protein
MSLASWHDTATTQAIVQFVENGAPTTCSTTGL